MPEWLRFDVSCPLNFNQVHVCFQVKRDLDGNCVPVDLRMGFLNEGSQVTLGFKSMPSSSSELDNLGVPSSDFENPPYIAY